MNLTQSQLSQAALAAREIEAALFANQAIGSGSDSLPARLRHSAETMLPVLLRHRALFDEIAPAVADNAAHGARMLLYPYEGNDQKVRAIVADLAAIQSLHRAPAVVAECFEGGATYAESAAIQMLDLFQWAPGPPPLPHEQFYVKVEAALDHAEANLALPS